MNTTEFYYYLDAYINCINKIPLIEKDSRGFYTAKIAEIRYVPQNYK